ncbi:hypothetical protein [Ferdinandcohnia sp. Marseille-Q9671]
MELYVLKKNFNGYKRGTQFFLVAQSEFIGVKEFVLRTKDLTHSLSLSENEFKTYFRFIKTT